MTDGFLEMDADGPDLRRLREDRGLSQSAVATFAGVVQVAVSNWEAGYTAVPVEKRPSLRRLFGVSDTKLEAALDRSRAQWEHRKDTRLGDHLKALQEERQVTRQTIAEATDVTTGAILWWETGVSRPTRLRLEPLAELFDTSPRDLLLAAGWSNDEIEGYLQPDEPDRNPVAVLLRAAREHAGLNQSQVAAAIGMAQGTVSALELGQFLPNPETWAKLIELYELDPTDAAVAHYQARRDTGSYPEVALAWPLDPAVVPRPRWFRQLRAHLGTDRAELAGRIGVERYDIANVEQPERELPRPLRRSLPLRKLAEMSMSSELALRQAWQRDEVAGLEHLVGLDGEELVRAAHSAGEVLRFLVACGVTLTDIGGACGVSREAVRQWVAERTRPRAAAFAGVSELLGVSPQLLQDLRDREDSAQHKPPAADASIAVEHGPANRTFDRLPDDHA